MRPAREHVQPERPNYSSPIPLDSIDSTTVSAAFALKGSQEIRYDANLLCGTSEQKKAPEMHKQRGARIVDSNQAEKREDIISPFLADRADNLLRASEIIAISK